MTPNWQLGGCLLILAVLYLTTVNGVAVMSVDLGSEWMKVAIVSPGVPMEIALNKESKRKTPAFIAFRDAERTFGEDAQTVGVRFPANGYGYLLELLGKKVDHPLVQLYMKRFPYYNITADPVRGTVVFQHDSETTYTPEELIGMLLHKAKEFAEESAGQPISDVVLTVPGYFNQAERKAMMTAANLAELKVLQLLNDYTGVALNYGIFRRKDFNETTQYIMFYDMGASSTSATLVSYQLIKQKEKGLVEINPQASVLGVGYDRTLGGLEMQLRLQRHLAEQFNLVKKTSKNVFDNPRAMAKLFKEAGRVKNILSANADFYAQVEGLLDEEDFKLQVSREQLELLCADLYDRVRVPIDQALKSAGLTIDVVNQIILVGAGTRVPKVQDMLSRAVGMDLSKNINADEAAVMGAAYKAADIATGFKVKKFITKDAVLFPVQVTFERTSENNEVKTVKRTLFGPMNPYPQKKVITFNKHTDDFSFNVNYAEVDYLPQVEVDYLGPLNLSRIDLTGVKDALTKHQTPSMESKGIKAHLLMDESGLLKLVNVELVVEKNVTADYESESTLQKLGSSFSKLFGGTETKEDVKPVAENQDEEGTTPEPDVDSSQSKENQTDSTASGGTADSKNLTDTNTTTPADTPKLVVVKETIASSTTTFGVLDITEEQLKTSLAKIFAFNEYDRQKQRKEKAQNALESFVFDAQNKLELGEYQKAATDDEKKSIVSACQQMASWLEEEGYDSDAASYEEKLTQLKTLVGPLYRRVREHQDRPEALAALHSMLNGSKSFLNTVLSTTHEAINKGEETIFTQVEIDTLTKTITDIEEWLTKTDDEQKKLPLSANPKLTVRSISEKMATLDREVKYLVNKAKIWKPKVTPDKTKNETGEKKEDGGGTEEEVPEVVADDGVDDGQVVKNQATTSDAPHEEQNGEAEGLGQKKEDNEDNHQEL